MKRKKAFINNAKRLERQLQETLIIEMLTKAGWHKTIKGETFKKADMEYQNDTMELEVECNSKGNSVYLSIYDKSGLGMDLAIEFKDKLLELLKTIISFQDTISPTNFREYVRMIKAVCPSIYVDIGDKLVPLIDENL